MSNLGFLSIKKLAFFVIIAQFANLTYHDPENTSSTLNFRPFEI